MRSRIVSSAFILVCALIGCGGGGGGGPTPTKPTPSPSPGPTITLTGLPGSVVGANATYALSVTETIGGHAVTPGPLTFALDNAALGTLSGATYTAGLSNASGHITVTDASHGLSTTVALSVATTYPATNGDTIAYAGTINQQIVRPIPAPSAIPPPFNTAYTVSVAGSTTTNATFNGQGGLIDYRLVETDTQTSPTIATTTTTDTFVNFAPGSGGTIDVQSAGSSSLDSNNVTDSTVLGPGNGLLDILPEQSGATWSNGAALTFNETEADASTLARTVASDGSYAEKIGRAHV